MTLYFMNYTIQTEHSKYPMVFRVLHLSSKKITWLVAVDLHLII